MIKPKQSQPEKLTDTSPMPFGVHKGERMIDVPESYLLYLWTNGLSNGTGSVHDYIKDNLDSIKSKQRK